MNLPVTLERHARVEVVIWRTLCMSGTFLLATFAMRFFDPKTHCIGHLAFGQIFLLSFQLIYYHPLMDDAFERVSHKNGFFLIHFIALGLFPTLIARTIVNRWIEPIFWVQSVKRTVYLVSFASGFFVLGKTAK